MPTPDEEAWCALDQLVDALRESLTLTEAAIARAEQARAQRGTGLRWTELAVLAERPMLVEMLTRILDRQALAGSRFRRAAARALYAEGMNMDAIADVFGVTRQRVSTLIRARQST